MKRFCTLLATLLLFTAVGCQHSAAPADYARVVIRNGSDTEVVTIEVADADGEVVISELLEPKSSANARSTPGAHTATATVTGAEGDEAATYSESFEVQVVGFVTYNSASEDAEAGLTVNAPSHSGGEGDGGDEGETDGEGETGGEGDGEGETDPSVE